LSISLDRVGEVRLAAGDWAGALVVFEESLDVGRKLAAAEPRNAEWRRESGPVATGMNWPSYLPPAGQGALIGRAEKFRPRRERRGR
jgi:hypothetical protein